MLLLISFFFVMYSFVMNRSYLFLALLSLEIVVLIVYLAILCSVSLYGSEYYVLLVYLTFSVIEGALGLSILVNVIRVYGNDYVNSVSVLW
uniref:NADH dehydrogenase subunit 4L n=1 Tax=Taiwanaptera montana TaxID=3135762 RepID=UPI0031F3E0ED